MTKVEWKEQLGATGFEPATSCSQSTEPIDVTPCGTRTDDPPCGECCTAGCTKYSGAPTDEPGLPHDLAVVVTAWVRLPGALRAGIVAMVQSVATTPLSENDRQ